MKFAEKNLTACSLIKIADFIIIKIKPAIYLFRWYTNLGGLCDGSKAEGRKDQLL